MRVFFPQEGWGLGSRAKDLRFRGFFRVFRGLGFQGLRGLGSGFRVLG